VRVAVVPIGQFGEDRGDVASPFLALHGWASHVRRARLGASLGGRIFVPVSPVCPRTRADGMTVSPGTPCRTDHHSLPCWLRFTTDGAGSTDQQIMAKRTHSSACQSRVKVLSVADPAIPEPLLRDIRWGCRDSRERHECARRNRSPGATVDPAAGDSCLSSGGRRSVTYGCETRRGRTSQFR
jgi:hypothetical protein